jgi:hypothetical protein
MLPTELEYLCTELECRLECWNAFNRVGIRLYRVEMLSTEWEYLCTEVEYLFTGLKCFLEGWHAFSWTGMLSCVLECFRQGWNTLV